MLKSENNEKERKKLNRKLILKAYSFNHSFKKELDPQSIKICLKYSQNSSLKHYKL